MMSRYHEFHKTKEDLKKEAQEEWDSLDQTRNDWLDLSFRRRFQVYMKVERDFVSPYLSAKTKE